MKATKMVSLLLAAVLVLALAGCGSSVPANKVFSADDLPGVSIGVQENTTGDIYASDYEEQGSTVERYSKGNDAVQALVQGKLDCVIIDNEPAKAFIEANDSLTILEEPFALEDYAICVSKDNPDLTAALNTAMAELKADGTIGKIVDHYINGGDFVYESTATEAPNGELIMATNAYFPPYEYYEGGEVVGIDADVAQALCDKLGYSLKIEDMEFGSIIAAVQSGKVSFGMAGMTVTEERLQSIDFTDSYATGVQVIIVRKK